MLIKKSDTFLIKPGSVYVCVDRVVGIVSFDLNIASAGILKIQDGLISDDSLIFCISNKGRNEQTI